MNTGANDQNNRSELEDRIQVLNQRIQGLVTRKGDDNQQPFLIWDVSEGGIGIWTAEKLAPADGVTLTVGKPYLLVVSCEVNWCEPNPESGGFRSGLKVVNTDTKVLSSLYHAFVKAGQVGDKAG